jgi:RNA 2',3'-cyclic 3'-phosphodiesterase
MPEQLSFAGFAAAQRPDRLLLAILPDADGAARAEEVKHHQRGKHGLRSKLILEKHFHITLIHNGDYVGLPQGIVAAVCEAAAGVVMAPFDVAFDRVMSFSGKPDKLPLVLRGGDGLVALITFQQILVTAIRRAGLRYAAGSHFTPHMTLLYGDRRVAEEPIKTVGWTVREFVLVHSLLSLGRHVLLGRWALRG